MSAKQQNNIELPNKKTTKRKTLTSEPNVHNTMPNKVAHLRRKSLAQGGRVLPALQNNKKKPSRTVLMQTLISDFHTRSVLKDEFKRLQRRFLRVWAKEDRIVQTWQTLYEHDFNDTDNGWTATASTTLSDTFVNEVNEIERKLAVPSSNYGSMNNFNSMANLRSNIYSASDMLGASRSRQVSQEKAIAKGIHNTITQALLDRLLLLSLWFNERDLYKDLVEQLLTAGADPNWVSPKTAELGVNNSPIFYGRSALHLAACKGHVVCLELLLNANANISALDEFDSTPLHLASLAGELASVRLLIDKGINIQAEDRYGKSALHLAFEALDYNAEYIRFNESEATNSWGGAQDVIHKKNAGKYSKRRCEQM